LPNERLGTDKVVVGDPLTDRLAVGDPPQAAKRNTPQTASETYLFMVASPEETFPSRTTNGWWEAATLNDDESTRKTLNVKGIYTLGRSI
jgi:hypothetical protein